MIGRWLFWPPVDICAALAPCKPIAANGVPENAENGVLVAAFDLAILAVTIDEMLRQSPTRYGVSVSRTPFGKRW